MEEIKIVVADESHEKYVDTILQTISDAASVRGTGIARRTHEYLLNKIVQAKAVIALCGDRFAGFSYIETWENKKYVTTSGLIVHPDFRGRGIAKKIKDLTFSLARTRWPNAKIFSLTSGAAVMTMNTQLGYKPVTFAELTDDDAFWDGCNGCQNVDILRRTDRHYCICTAMLFDPEEHLPAKIPEDVLERIAKLDNAPQPPRGGLNRKPLYQNADCAAYGLLKEFASEHRKNPTQTESIMWDILKEKRLGASFRRQHIIGQYIADFVCLSHKLVIEIDGNYHSLPEQQISDETRTKWLNEHGLKVLRFKNEEIIGNTEEVINKIKKELWQTN
ncbi:MAG: DUF559 domain-containing protein [Prevotella sp.]|nr:DUF559 domain-containing protein [Prevotella sp.]